MEAIGSQAKSRFTDHITKVAVEVKPMKAADRGKAEKAQREAALKKALSD